MCVCVCFRSNDCLSSRTVVLSRTTSIIIVFDKNIRSRSRSHRTTAAVKIGPRVNAKERMTPQYVFIFK